MKRDWMDPAKTEQIRTLYGYDTTKIGLGKPDDRYKKTLLVLTLSLTLSCSVPKIILLEDPLTAEEHINLGYVYESRGNLKLAEEEYKKAIKKDKNLWKAHFNLGNVYAKQGRYSEAEREYRKALEINPEEPDTLNNLAWVLNKQGRKEEALEAIKKAISIRDEDTYRETLREIEER